MQISNFLIIKKEKKRMHICQYHTWYGYIVKFGKKNSVIHIKKKKEEEKDTIFLWLYFINWLDKNIYLKNMRKKTRCRIRLWRKFIFVYIIIPYKYTEKDMTRLIDWKFDMVGKIHCKIKLNEWQIELSHILKKKNCNCVLDSFLAIMRLI